MNNDDFNKEYILTTDDIASQVDVEQFFKNSDKTHNLLKNTLCIKLKGSNELIGLLESFSIKNQPTKEYSFKFTIPMVNLHLFIKNKKIFDTIELLLNNEKIDEINLDDIILEEYSIINNVLESSSTISVIYK